LCAKNHYKLTGAKTACTMLVKPIAGVYFTNILRAAFMLADPKSGKKTDSFTVFFCAFGICMDKSCKSNVGEIDPRFLKLK